MQIFSERKFATGGVHDTAPPMTETPVPGWRERKRRETHRRVWESAIALFAENGYEATTLDAIAEASGISKRTFFHYFKSKEEILVGWQVGLPDLFRAAVIAEPLGETPLDVLRNVMAKMPTPFDADQAVLINRIIRSHDQLQAGNLAKLLRMEQAAYEGLCERWPQPERRGAHRIVAIMAIAALRLAIDNFTEGDGKTPLVDLVREAFTAMAVELAHA